MSTMSESTLELLSFAYFGVFFALVIGHWLYTRKRDPLFRWRWHARAALLTHSILGACIVVLVALTSESWTMTGLALAMIIVLSFLNVTMTTTCHACGKFARVDTWLFDAKHCVYCGTFITRSPLIAPSAATPPGMTENTEPRH